jgi:chaperone modulatory protein CbpM
MSSEKVLKGEILGDDVWFTLDDLCRSCALPRDHILLLVEEGIIEPVVMGTGSEETRSGEQHSVEHWRFEWRSLTRVRTSKRLQRDLGVNPAGVALALELMERIDQLERQLNRGP